MQNPEWKQNLVQELRALGRDWEASGFTGVCAGDDTVFFEPAGAQGQEGALDKDDRILLTPHAPFLLGYCALLMQRAGLVCLTDPLKTHLPFYPWDGSILDALRHQTTLADFTQARGAQGETAYEQALAQDGAHDARAVVQILENERLMPTQMGEYSASNVVLARAALEKACGMPIIEALRQFVFEPLGMTHTGAGVPDADCFLYDGTRVTPRQAAHLSGALCTTAQDLLRLLRALCTAQGLGKKEARLLFAGRKGRGVCFERIDGVQTSCAQALGFSCNFYIDPQHDICFLHMDCMPQTMALDNGQWTYYRKELRSAVAAAVTYPQHPRLVRYGWENMRAATALELKDEQLSYVMDARGCLCRALALGRRAKAFVLCEGALAVGLLVTLKTEIRETYEIDALLIDRRFQGRGYGRILLQEGVAYLKRCGAREIRVGLSAQNDAARKLYEKGGFVPVQGDGEELLMRLEV